MWEARVVVQLGISRKMTSYKAVTLKIACQRNSQGCPKRNESSTVAEARRLLFEKSPFRRIGRCLGGFRGCRGFFEYEISLRKLGTPVAMSGNRALVLTASTAYPVKSDDKFMIAIVPLAERQDTARFAFDYLLLGDLRGLLDEPSGLQRDRWLIATIDMLLISRPRTEPAVFLPAAIRAGNSVNHRSAEDGIPFDRLQRLRDRIVHRAPCGALIEELREDLREWSNGQTGFPPTAASA